MTPHEEENNHALATLDFVYLVLACRQYSLFPEAGGRKIDTVLVRMPQVPHGVGSNYISHLCARTLYLMKWFDKYIR